MKCPLAVTAPPLSSARMTAFFASISVFWAPLPFRNIRVAILFPYCANRIGAPFPYAPYACVIPRVPRRSISLAKPWGIIPFVSSLARLSTLAPLTILTSNHTPPQVPPRKQAFRFRVVQPYRGGGSEAATQFISLPY